MTVVDGNESGASDTAEVIVNIGDANDAPELVEVGPFEIAENTTGSLGTITAVDPDGDTLSFSVSDETNFSIDSSTGELSLVVGQDFETVPSLSVDVTVVDGNGGSDVATVTVNILDANDAPELVEVGPFEIAENTTGSLGTITAIDEDGDTLSFSVSDETNFSIDSSTGELSLIVAQDSEVVSTLRVDVTVTDESGASDTAEVIVNIGDANDAPELVEVGPFEIAENTTGSLGTITAVDPDGDTLSFSVSDETNFSIDSSTGELSLVVGQDFETVPSLSVDVTVVDGNGGSDVATVTVNILDANDAPELVEVGPFEIAENTTGSLGHDNSD